MRGGWRRLRSASAALSYVDQGLVSGGNFATGVVLARTLSQDDFGLFVLANLALLFSLGLLNASALQPLVINGAALDETRFRRFLTGNLPMQGAFIALSAGLVAAAALLWEPLRPHALPLAAAAALWQVQELCRRVLYTRGRMGAAMANNAVNYGLQAVLVIGAAALAGPGLGLGTVFALMAATSGLAVLVGVRQLRGLVGGPADDAWAVARRNIEIGRWVALTFLLCFASVQAYPAIVAAVVGLASTAGFGVIFQVLGPAALLLKPIENYYLPRATHALEHGGTPGLNRVLWSVARVGGPPYLLYILAVAAAPSLLLGRVYGEAYAQHADALRLFALVQPLHFVVAMLMLELNARRLQRWLPLSQVWNVLVVYLLGVYLIAQVGLVGAAIASGAAAAGEVVLLGLAIARERRRGAAAVALRPAELTT